ncbi:MAG: hypothetical protein Q4D62_07475 [Planctomycetia bacterium]|nr:hypothetical protein [Planctomycetia bacterium]
MEGNGRVAQAGVVLQGNCEAVGKIQNNREKWGTRAERVRVERVDGTNRGTCRRVAHNRIDLEIENQIVKTRKFLKEKSISGECGARVIRSVWEENGCSDVPSVRTIHNVLRRNGLLDRNRQRRFPTPPPGWMIPEVRDKRRRWIVSITSKTSVGRSCRSTLTL